MSMWKNDKDELFDDMGGKALELPSWPKDLIKLTKTEAERHVAALEQFVPE